MHDKIFNRGFYRVKLIIFFCKSVVYGYVGNKAAVFPLQLHGLEIDPIHTCQFSNHAGYDTCTGLKTSGDEINKIIPGKYSSNIPSDVA